MAVEFENKPATPDAQSDTQVVDTDVVACDGSGPAFGHPRVYLNFGHEHEIVCPYCSRKYILAAGAKRSHH